MSRRILSFLTLIALLLPAMSTAQGVQTGTLRGTVTSPDGAPVNEAAVVVTSPALQGERATATDINGVFVLPTLPPGTYTIRIAKDGMKAVELTAVVPLGGSISADARLSVAAVTESVVVEGVRPSAVTEIQTSTNITAREVNALPMGRTPYLIAELMPAVTTNTPSPNQLTISGGFAFDNVFLIDGVDVNDNLLGTVNDLYIEDAISEVQVLSSSISAEYGRFSGGVVNIITKSGGNNFSGGYRATFSRPSWTNETPFERANNVERGKPTAANPFLTNKLSHFGELTLGGPAVKDRVWFFAAGRFEDSSTQGALQVTGIPYTKTNDNKRYEAKVTGTVRPSQTLQGTFVDNRVHRANEPVLSFSIDPAAMISPSTPNRLGVVNYNGALSPRMLFSAQYSQRHFSTEGVGGTSTNIVDSPFLTASGALYQYNAPYFDASDPEERNNRQLTASLSYFASSSRTGSHELKGGVEHFVDTRVGANAQSSTGYVFLANFKADASGAPVLDANGRLIPQFVPGSTLVERWIPHRGVQFNLTTLSAYVQDRWMVSPNLTLNLGMRFEHASSDDTTGINSVSSSRVVPRLGASYAIGGDGSTVLQTSFSQYSGKYNAQQFSKNTNVGNSDRYTTVYMGPAGEGRGFTPGFDVNNYAGVVGGSFPAANIHFEDGLSTPITTEFTLGAAKTFGRSYGKVMFVKRSMSNFIEDFIQIGNGTTPITIDGEVVGELDNIDYRNSDELKREYQALEFMGQHRVTRAVTVNGHWTVQLKNDGTFEGETPNPAGTVFGNYPEMLSLARSLPDGHLDDFQRSKVRVWADYQAGLGEYGSVMVAPIFRYNSARTYSLAVGNVPLTSIQAARNPGYAAAPRQTVFFDERGSESFKGYALVDLAVTYSVPVWKTAQPWIKFQAFNLFNNQTLIAWDTTVTLDPASPLDSNGLPTGYKQGARYGQGTSNTHYPGPRPGADGGRAMDVAVGFRF